jgi:PAS domain S-box-containing protein
MSAATKPAISEERLQFIFDAASMGTWDWDLATHTVRWSDNLERMHGLPAGTFDGTFSSYEREIHPDDRERVLSAVRRAIEEGARYEVEYRIVAPDGSVRWVEGKGRVEYEDGRPVRMTGVCMLVTRRKEAELARLAAAEEASRLKDQFLATLSHELRTPLNAILGWIQLMQTDTLSPERTRQAIDVISRNAKLQAQLIEDILDVSRIITGKLDIEPRPVLVPHVIDTVLNSLMPSAAAKRIEIARDVPEHLPAIEGDPKRLQQVLSNIVSNAIKFTPEHGHVGVKCAADGDAICIEVRDSGSGIAKDLLPFVFDRFRQGESGATRVHGGLGLGLAIARHLVERHGGQIDARSDGPGQGTTFHIRLPIGSACRPASDPLRSIGPIHLQLNGAKVLIVEDQRDSLDLLAAIFDQCGAAVVLCESAELALEALGRIPVDLLVADIAMPGMDGYELIQHVRRFDDDRRHVPAVAVSAYARLEDRDRALASGFNAYCAKPLDASAFLGVIDAVLTAAASSAAQRVST